MTGRMYQVSILLDEEKIRAEGQYDFDELQKYVIELYRVNGFQRGDDLEDGSMLFYGVKGMSDRNGYFNTYIELRCNASILRLLKKWYTYENDKCDSSDEFSRSDVFEGIAKVAQNMSKVKRLRRA